MLVIALLLYEYLVTLDDERSLVWTQGTSASSWIFQANRVVLVVQALGNIGSTGTIVSLRFARHALAHLTLADVRPFPLDNVRRGRFYRCFQMSEDSGVQSHLISSPNTFGRRYVYMASTDRPLI